MTRTLRAELLKLRTARTSRAFLLAVAGHGGVPPLGDPAMQASLLGTGRVAGLLAAFLGSIAMSGEYRHGTITPTLLATPRRGQVVAAAAAANLAAGAALGLAAALTAALGAAAALIATGAALAAWGLALTAGGWVAVRRAEAR